MDNSLEIKTKTQKRYTEESKSSCNLSCGSNLDFLHIKKGEIVLDLGCGRGEDTIQASLLTGPKGIVHGLDITEAMINKAKIRAKELGTQNVVFTLGDIDALSYDDESINSVMSSCVINHAKSKVQVYKEIYRVLKPSGKFVISDAVTKYPLPEEVKNDPEAWAECFGGSITEEEYLESIKSAGFENIEILKRREYLKNGYDFISLTILAYKN
ncbi:methyltransferase domain-containing protein [Clostridium sp.]|uniref:methyltransferase domain-containing protein n=1 Tax=Clostridium sp. TaxID=1506 RepID=UPI0025C17014|nr:methyltransferase domain-containing protein [Clostridium sp.]